MAVVACGIAGGLAYAAQQTVAGKLIFVKNPKATDASKRTIVYFAKELSSNETVVGDPTVSGAKLKVKLDGNTQCFAMPASGWTPISTIGFKYKDATGANGPVKTAFIKLTKGGVFLNKAVILGKFGPGPQPHITVVPPNPGVEADTNFSIGGGDQYCAAFPGATANPNDDKGYKVKDTPDPGTCAVSACSPSGAFLEEVPQ
jgi:hypothetical protein